MGTSTVRRWPAGLPRPLLTLPEVESSPEQALPKRHLYTITEEEEAEEEEAEEEKDSTSSPQQLVVGMHNIIEYNAM